MGEDWGVMEPSLGVPFVKLLSQKYQFTHRRLLGKYGVCAPYAHMAVECDRAGLLA